MKNLKVEIVTPVHNRRELTVQFLKSLSRIDRSGLDVHVIVVDDGSTDGTENAVRENYPEVEIVKGDGNLWYTAGTNRGIEAALKRDPDYILTANNDLIFEEKCVRRMVECAEKHRRSVIGAVLLDWDAPHKIFQVSPKWDVWSGGWRHWYQQTVWTIPQKPWTVEVIAGNCVLFPVQVIKEVGLMDEKRMVQYGDAEYTPRMRKQNWNLLIEPRARVFCKPNEAPPKLRKNLLKNLFFNPHGAHSLRRRLNMNLNGAPNRLEGLFAFAVFFVRLALGKNAEGRWAQTVEEKPLSETYADKIVKG